MRRSFRLARLLPVALLAVAGCPAGGTREWIVSSPYAGVDRVTCRVIRGGCDAGDAEIVHETAFCAAAGAGTSPTGLVAEQTYGYHCRADDCCGQPIAEGCVELVHPPEGDIRVAMDRRLVPESACSGCSSLCIADPPDAARIEAGPPPFEEDAGRDASVEAVQVHRDHAFERAGEPSVAFLRCGGHDDRPMVGGVADGGREGGFVIGVRGPQAQVDQGGALARRPPDGFDQGLPARRERAIEDLDRQ
jgi:hypothetical protein